MPPPCPRALPRSAPVLLLAAGLMALSACDPAPVLDGRITAAAAAAHYPVLEPLPPLLARAAAPDRTAPGTGPALDSTSAGLRARAAALRGPVIAPAVRARLQGGVSQPALR